MNTLTETSRPSGIAGKGDAVEFVPAILKLKSILVPIDFSKISRKGLEYRCPLQSSLEQRSLCCTQSNPLPTQLI